MLLFLTQFLFVMIRRDMIIQLINNNPVIKNKYRLQTKIFLIHKRKFDNKKTLYSSEQN